MVQREVGERLAAAAGDPAYGIPSVKVAYWATAALVGRVPPTVFLPQPKVESVLLRIRPAAGAGGRPRPGPRSSRWCGPRSASAARCCGGRSPAWSTPAAFDRAGVSPDARPEELDIEAWGRLTDAVACSRAPSGPAGRASGRAGMVRTTTRSVAGERRPRRTRSSRCRPGGATRPVASARRSRHSTRRGSTEQGRRLEVVDRSAASRRCRVVGPAQLVPAPVHGRRRAAEGRRQQGERAVLEGQGLDDLADAAHPGPPAHQAEGHVGAQRGRRVSRSSMPAQRSTAAASADPPPRPAPGGMRLITRTCPDRADQDVRARPTRLVLRRLWRDGQPGAPVDHLDACGRSVRTVRPAPTQLERVGQVERRPSRRRSGGSRRRGRR